MFRFKYYSFFCLLGVLLIARSQLAYAQIPTSSLEQKLLAADFVFQGVVVNIQYQFSQPENEGDSALPYTFVTYQVQNIFKGSYNQPTLTLRFLGGPLGNGRVYFLEGAPLFDVGDADILLVKGNNIFPCPLVTCAGGRFRYINGVVVNEMGQLILFNPDGSLATGEVIQSDAITDHQMGEGLKIQRHDVNESDSNEIPQVDARDEANREGKIVPDTASFTNHMQKAVVATHTQEELNSQVPFQSADPKKPFREPSNLVNEPPAIVDEPSIPEEEQRERELERLRREQLQTHADTPEKKTAQKKLNSMMEQEHSEFYAGTDHTMVPVTSTAENNGNFQNTQKKPSYLLLISVALIAILGVALWRKQRAKKIG